MGSEPIQLVSELQDPYVTEWLLERCQKELLLAKVSRIDELAQKRFGLLYSLADQPAA